MTIEDARRILGKKVEHLSDEELLAKMVEVHDDLEDFFQETLEKLASMKNEDEQNTTDN